MEKPLRFIRMASGVYVVAVMTHPLPCPGRCNFCPEARGAPKSYLPDSPVVLRAGGAGSTPTGKLRGA